MGDIIRLLFAVFSVYCLSSLISSLEGPYIGWPKSEQQIGIFKAVRIKLGAYSYGVDGKPESNLGRGISCPLCVAAYISIFVILLFQYPTVPSNLFLAWTGIWGISMFLENLTSDDAVQSAIEEVAESLEDSDGRFEN